MKVLKNTEGWDALPSSRSPFSVDLLEKDVFALITAFFFCQVVEDGYEFFAKRQLVTLFSAPNYCGEFDNAGGMMSVDETLMCSFQVSSYPCDQSLLAQKAQSRIKSPHTFLHLMNFSRKCVSMFDNHTILLF